MRQVPVLTPQDCEEVACRVHSLRDSWTPREKSDPCYFFTLGAASYLDGPSSTVDHESYYTLARSKNSVLSRNFFRLYDKMTRSLEIELNAPVLLYSGFALPGFHIWLSKGILTKPVASLHFDLQYQRLRWNADDKLDFSRTLSFTLPLRLPAAGGGLYIWDLTLDEYMDAKARGYVDTIEELQRFKKMRFWPYDLGCLVLHSGHELHQIAPVPRVYDNDERMTLQGHGIMSAKGWRIYW
jgi:hypothetical protein